MVCHRVVKKNPLFVSPPVPAKEGIQLDNMKAILSRL